MSYKPFTTEYTYQIIDDIKEYLEETNKDQTTLDTLDLCHLIGETERLNNIINEANKILSNILVVSDWEHKGKYRPIKNTTSQEVYKSVCMLYGILKTPYRSDYGSLQELKGDDK